eukprot:3280046-Rhodomonas_salina.1
MSHAKSKVGVMSMYAVQRGRDRGADKDGCGFALQECRDLFWGLMGKGKGFAKRASTWDLLFMGLGSM